MTITWALSCFLVFELEADDARRRRLLLIFYCFVGLSLLAKGLVGVVIPFGVIGMYLCAASRVSVAPVLTKSHLGVTACTSRVRDLVRTGHCAARLAVHRRVLRATSFRALPLKQISPSRPGLFLSGLSRSTDTALDGVACRWNREGKTLAVARRGSE